MRIPIKINISKIPSFFSRLGIVSEDPRPVINSSSKADEYTAAIGAFKFGSTFKTTKARRYLKTIDCLVELGYSDVDIVLDVGASDGSTSLDVMGAIKPKRYYLTDFNLNALYQPTKYGALFIDKNRKPVLFFNNWIVVYNDPDHAIWPLRFLAKIIIRGALSNKSGREQLVTLVNPGITTLSRDFMKIREFNVLTPWTEEKVDLIIAGNLLNRSYFSEDQIVLALKNLANALNEGGVLAIIENRKFEQSTIFKLRDGKFEIQSRVGNGAEIESLAVTLN